MDSINNMENNTPSLYVSCPACGDEESDIHKRMQLLRTLCISVLFTMPLLWDMNPKIQLVFATVVQFYPGQYFYRGAIRGLKEHILGMDFLVSLSTTIIYAYSVYITFTVHDHIKVYYLSECVLLSLILFGKYMETTSRYEASAAIRRLIRLQPDTATVLRDGQELILNLDKIRTDDVLLVRSGEHIPIDGIIINGTCTIDESMLTGESETLTKTVGDKLYCGTLCLDGEFKLSCEGINHVSMLQQIIDVVSAAQTDKAPITRLSDRIATIFVPAVSLVALGVFLLWYYCLAPGDMGTAISCLCSTLVIACPCALGLATPTAIMSGSGRAAELGILFKGGEQLENAYLVDTVVFDKTYTLTTGLAKTGEDEELRPGAVESIESLQTMGIDVWIVSGDKAAKANNVAERLGVDISRVISEVMPTDKAELVRRLQEDGRRVAMVGDGINDSPALANADIGIAMGNGTDIAIDTAGVMLVGSNLYALKDVWGISECTVRNIRQNLIWALIYNIIFIPLAAIGIVNPSMAAAAMSLSSNGVLLHSLKVRNYGNDKSKIRK